MTTECSEPKLLFQAHGGRTVEATFDGGMITSDGGALLLRELELKRQIVSDFARCFTDHRDPGMIEFTVEQLLKQRIFGLAWVTKTSTITTGCAWIPCWRWSAGAPM